jgi:hypothetical protein
MWVQLMVNCPLDCSNDSFLLDAGNFTSDNDYGNGHNEIMFHGSDDIIFILNDINHMQTFIF